MILYVLKCPYFFLEPKSFPERNSDEEDKAEKSPGGTPDETPENSPSPVKSPNKKGIFGGIISPSLLKVTLLICRTKYMYMFVSQSNLILIAQS